MARRNGAPGTDVGNHPLSSHCRPPPFSAVLSDGVDMIGRRRIPLLPFLAREDGLYLSTGYPIE